MALRKRGNFLNLLQKEGGSLRKGGFQPWRKLWTEKLLEKITLRKLYALRFK